LADVVVVMDQGHIEQAASAREVYSEPLSAYVARFMGGQNVLYGEIVEVTAGKVRLTLAGGGLAEFKAPNGAAPRTTVYFSMRRDRIKLAPAGDGDGKRSVNSVRGRVRGTEYQGSWVKITLEVMGSEDFVINLPDSEFFAHPVQPGDTVEARWNADEVHLLKGGGGRSDRPYSAGQN
jgi:putative spermidine/putrescine transport system ATP-binding protein